MALKPRTKRRIFLSIASLVGAVAIAVVMVPPMITLNRMAPRIERAIAEQTGMPAQIRGKINFSLLGGATIVAHDITIPDGTVNAALIRIPLYSLFDLDNAPLTGDIIVYGARITATKLVALDFAHKITVHNSVVEFLGKDYEIIQGDVAGGTFRGTVRTNQHKYDINFAGDEFVIKNHTNNLLITGQLFSDGSAHGHLSMQTDDINTWFEFTEPQIHRTVKLSMNFDWDGGYGFVFSDIRGDTFTGHIELFPDGRRNIQMVAHDLDYDFSFLTRPGRLFYDTTFNLDFSGDLTFAGREFHHIKIRAVGTKDSLQIATLVADDITVTGGVIDADGAHNLMIAMPLDGRNAMCLFSGTPDNWQCREFTYGAASGSLSVENGKFNIAIMSTDPMPDQTTLMRHIARLGDTGTLTFQYADIAGTIDITPKRTTPSYKFARNRRLEWLNMDMAFLPDAMRAATGDFTWDGDTLEFTPHSGDWHMAAAKDFFYIHGKNFKMWMPDMDMRALKDLDYSISGNYKNGNISNLTIKIADQVFTGSVAGNTITLHTQLLNADSFVNQDYIDNYEEQQYLTGAPLMLPFGLGVNVSLSADTMIYNANTYANFVYALKSGVQTFSITDSDRGNLLATIRADKKKYTLALQLNRFVIHGKLLASDMPINISDTTITAAIDMTTSGQIAYDVWHNLAGTVDLTFDGGTLWGLGIDEFYASAANITTLNAEYALASALESGQTQIKKMQIIGRYADGAFETTQPIKLSMRHTDATGNLEIRGTQMMAQLNLTLRGTSPMPAPIALTINPTGNRDYSLSQIMIDFDPEFMRDFVRTHNRF
ncbi:MAG: hypothetical protein K2L95_00245 [Alphaproteobacteria bacterium]|nr:hypothetical protein [Alphaproteobacteria bacterium]